MPRFNVELHTLTLLHFIALRRPLDDVKSLTNIQKHTRKIKYLRSSSTGCALRAWQLYMETTLYMNWTAARGNSMAYTLYNPRSWRTALLLHFQRQQLKTRSSGVKTQPRCMFWAETIKKEPALKHREVHQVVHGTNLTTRLDCLWLYLAEWKWTWSLPQPRAHFRFTDASQPRNLTKYELASFKFAGLVFRSWSGALRVQLTVTDRIRKNSRREVGWRFNHVYETQWFSYKNKKKQAHV